MAFFEIKGTHLQSIESRNLAELGLLERRDIQALLRNHIQNIGEDLLIISEEFGNWEDSKRRIDLLAVDKNANLVVIELKRGDTGVHMELQALRYAAMVSAMTFEQAVSTYEAFLGANTNASASEKLLQFLEWAEPNEEEFATDVRIILFSENFSLELTTTILWLLDRTIDITCYRISAYQLDGRHLLDFQRIIPLKEAEEYQIKVRNKQQEVQSFRRDQSQWNKELYANFAGEHRSWEDAQRYGFICAGGKDWFRKTLLNLTPGHRVWINRPGTGYIGVGIVEGPPVDAKEFMVQTDTGQQRYLDVAKLSDATKAAYDDPEKTDWFVPIRWLKTVPTTGAYGKPGLFGNQNSAVQPKASNWPTTVEWLKQAFGIQD